MLRVGQDFLVGAAEVVEDVLVASRCVRVREAREPAYLAQTRAWTPDGLPDLDAAGVATALWQHFVAAHSASCAMTVADRIMQWTGLGELLPQVFAAYASCADAAASIFGVPYEFYSLTLFIVLGGAALLHRRA